MNRRTALLLILSVCCTAVAAQPSAPIPIDSVTVLGERPLADAGAVVTRLDSFALRDNPSKSLADVLAQSTPLYVKSYGRGTLATVSMRGTSPSHTPLLWNGMKITSPMLGTADYSLVPSFFIDDARILHGAGSVGAAGGGFGGAILLDTRPDAADGFGLQFIQGVSSYRTFDEFLRLTYGNGNVKLSTRVGYVDSRNDFRFTNYDKTPDRDGDFPVERNRNGDFRDLHILQELYFSPNARDKFDAAVWFIGSRRNIPLISTRYADDDRFVNSQWETALRFTGGWQRNTERLRLGARSGYSFSRLRYLREEDRGNGGLNPMSDALNRVHTGFGSFTADWFPVRRLMLTAAADAYIHSVASREEITGEGYDKARAETSLRLAARYEPWRRLALGAEVRQESYGRCFTPLIYRGFADLLLWPAADLRMKLSGGRNYRFATLNDLYYKPGGNPDLRPESGYTFEAGIEGGYRRGGFSFTAGVTAYDSRIEDWILWLYSGNKGGAVWSPVNIGKVHSYGVEGNAQIAADMGRGWSLRVDGSLAWTPSINESKPMGENDASVGKQLPYVPLFSAAVTGRVGWRSWAFVWQFTHYSERFTTTSNELNYHLGNVAPYYMNDASLEKRFRPRWADLSLQLRVNNIFDEEYVSVLSRPMPGINFGIFVGITPKW